jgi:hypothetical protein
MKFETRGKEVYVKIDEEDSGYGLALKIGDTYECTINHEKYGVLLTNIEFKDIPKKFKDELFFSITVDFYHGDTLYKPNVYMYDPSRLDERETRFKLNFSTKNNHEQFWRTLKAADLGKQHHTEVSFLKDVIRQGHPSKVCMYQLALVREQNKDLFATLDRLKANLTYPFIKVVISGTLLSVYSIQKNMPMSVGMTVRVGDIINGSLRLDGLNDDDNSVTFSDRNGKKSIVSCKDVAFWSTATTTTSKSS